MLKKLRGSQRKPAPSITRMVSATTYGLSMSNAEVFPSYHSDVATMTVSSTGDVAIDIEADGIKKEQNQELPYRTWSSMTTFHGINDISESRTWYGRLSWSVFVTICLTLMVIYISSTIANLITAKSKWRTSVYTEVPLEGLPFPDVTLCSYNRLQRSAVESYNMSDELVQLFFEGYYGSYAIETSNHIGNPEYIKRFRDWRIKNNMTYERMFDKMGVPCNETLLEVSYGEIMLDDPCQKNDGQNLLYASNFLTMEYGRCLRFHFDRAPKIREVGMKAGSTFLLYTDTSQALPFITNNFIDTGFAMQLNFDSIEFGKWMTIPTGYHVLAAMSATGTEISHNRFELFAPNCELQPNLTLFLNESYSLTNCRLECNLTKVVEKCKCMPLDEYYECWLYATRNRTEYEIHYKQCADRCKGRCKSKMVNTKIMLGGFPRKVQRKATLEYLNQHYPHVDVDIDTLEERITILEISMVQFYEVVSLQTLVGDIGGQMGIAAGASVITIFQALIYGLSFCWNRLLIMIPNPKMLSPRLQIR